MIIKEDGTSYSENYISHLIDDIAGDILALKTNPNRESLEDINLVLNNMFTDSHCKDVIYTNNTDKQFFGVNVFPVLPCRDIFELIISDKKYIVPEYYVEIDSKLIHECNLSDTEIAIVILYNVTSLILDSTPIEKVRRMINEYLISSNMVIKKTDSFNYLELLSYGVRDAMRKCTSLFDISDDEVDNNEYMTNNSIKAISIKKKIQSQGKLMFVNGETPIIALSWVLRLYSSILKYRIDAKRDLREAIKITPSILDKRELETLARRLDRIDDDTIITESSEIVRSYNEGLLGDLLRSFKENGLKGYENDYYELKFAANNIENEDEAYALLSKINSRMSVIADFLTTEENLPNSSRARWTKLLTMYNDLRNQIADQKVYANKSRLYVNYGFED